MNFIPSSLRVYDSGFWRWLLSVWRLVRRCVRSEGVSSSGGGLLLLMLVEVEVEASVELEVVVGKSWWEVEWTRRTGANKLYPASSSSPPSSGFTIPTTTKRRHHQMIND